jgi:hypothetical protein
VGRTVRSQLQGDGRSERGELVALRITMSSATPPTRCHGGTGSWSSTGHAAARGDGGGGVGGGAGGEVGEDGTAVEEGEDLRPTA